MIYVVVRYSESPLAKALLVDLINSAAKGAKLIKPNQFETWIISEMNKFNKTSDRRFVELLHSDRTGKTFKVDNKVIFIPNKGKWIFTAEALSVIGMTSSERFRKNYIEYANTIIISY